MNTFGEVLIWKPFSIMSYDQGDHRDSSRMPVDNGVSLNALIIEELEAIVCNDNYRSLLSDMLPLYDEDKVKSREPEPGLKAGTISGSHRSRSHSDVTDSTACDEGNDPSVEEMPTQRFPGRKRWLKVGRKGEKMSAGGADTPLLS